MKKKLKSMLNLVNKEMDRGKGSLKIGIVGEDLTCFVEAMSNQIYLFSKELKAPVLTISDLGFLPVKRMEQYLIVNGRFLKRRTPLLSLLNGALFYLLLKLFERNFNVIYLSAGGINSRFLRYLDLKKYIFIATVIPFTSVDKEVKVFTQKFAPKLRGIIAQSKRTRARLIEMGIDREKVRLVYPWVDLDKFRYSTPPNMADFRILFVSAPRLAIGEVREDVFLAKGIPLMLETFKELIRYDKALLYLVWRGHYNDRLQACIRKLGLESQVKVIDGVQDMPEWYARSHITLIPFLNIQRSPEIPLSAVESLACGRPVVTTNVVEISEIIKGYGCGCVAKPNKKALLLALKECRGNYKIYQANCRSTARKLFSFE